MKHRRVFSFRCSYKKKPTEMSGDSYNEILGRGLPMRKRVVLQHPVIFVTGDNLRMFITLTSTSSVFYILARLIFYFSVCLSETHFCFFFYYTLVLYICYLPLNYPINVNLDQFVEIAISKIHII